MTNFLEEKIKKYQESIMAVFLWFCVWATYDTEISRFWNPGFPHNTLDLLHGLRSLFPFLALILSGLILFKKKFLPKKIFATPLGLLGIFTIIGIVASVFSKNPFSALYWGILYGSVILVLLTIVENKELLKRIIKINWIVAGILALGLTAFLFIQPGFVKSLTLDFLVCGQRPYESLGSIGAAINTFGVAGTRPTGLGRYAGVVAVVAFVSFCLVPTGRFSKKRSKFIWFFTFIIFLGILLFSKGKTEMIGFIIAMVFAILASNKLKISFILGAVFIILLTSFIMLYNIPCTNDISIINFNSPKIITPGSPKIITPGSPKIAVNFANGQSTSNTLRLINTKGISTLSGRTNGVWADAWHLFLKNPLLGFGFQADRFSLNGQHAHNSILHALIQTGILGTIPFVLAFILVFVFLFRLLKNPQIEQKERNFLIMISAVLVFFAVRSITESVAFFSADWLFMAPIIAYIQCLDSRIRKEKDNSEINFCGNKIDLIKTSDVIKKISYWIKSEPQKLHWIVNTGMHGIVEAEKHADFKYILSSSDMFVSDGISVVWLARLKGFNVKKRVTAADLMIEFFKVANKEGYSNYFYGDTEETLQALNKKILTDFPNSKIAGSYSPPFKKLTEQEDKIIIEKINQARPDVLWVGLGLPKQEQWIFKHKDVLSVPVVIGVGAGFKFLSGKVKMAPKWIGDTGFEWLWRLLHEPKRIWKRVFLYGPIFCWLVVKDLFF